MCSFPIHFYNYIKTSYELRNPNYVAAFFPFLSTVFSIIVYPWVFPINEKFVTYVRKNGVIRFIKYQPGLLFTPFIMAFVYPSSNKTLRLSPLKILEGIIFVDTEEYFRHRLEHIFSRVYKKVHKEHHQQRPITTMESFRNSVHDLLIPIIPFTIYTQMSDVTFIETMVVTSMAIIATYADHTLTGDKKYDKIKFHNIHHTSGWNNNFQQPFFSYWDSILGTKFLGGKSKYNPFIP